MNDEKKKRMLALVFSLVSVLSLVAVIPEVLNYVEFYKVTERFSFDLAEIKLDATRIDAGEALVALTFNATNPTSFVGLKVTDITCNLHFLKSSETQSLPGFSVKLSVPATVGVLQSALVRVNHTYRYTGEQQYESNVRFLISYVKAKPQQITWILTGQFTVEAYAYVIPANMGPFIFTENLD